MEQITLMKAVLALFRQNLNREQIVNELKIDGKKLDEEMDLFFSNPVPIQEKKPEKSNLPFDFDEKLELLNTNVLTVIKKYGKETEWSNGEYHKGLNINGLLKRLINIVFEEEVGTTVYLHKCLINEEMFNLSQEMIHLSRSSYNSIGVGRGANNRFKEMLKANGIDLPNSIKFTPEQREKLL